MRGLLEKDLASFSPSWHPGHPREREIFERFVRLFMRRADDPALAQRSSQSLLLELQDALRFIAVRAPRQTLVRVHAAGGEPGAGEARTAIQTCMNDQPFLVDSLRLALRRAGMRERFCSHPILSIRRDARGLIEDLGEAVPDGSHESFIHFEIDPAEPDKHEGIEHAGHGFDPLAGPGEVVGARQTILVRPVRNSEVVWR